MKKFLCLLACSAFLLGCETSGTEIDDGQDPEKVDIVFSDETDLAPVFDAEGGSIKITFTTQYNWSVSASDNWISVSPSSGKAGAAEVSITLAENTTGDERTGTVTITLSNGKTYDITVKQSFEDVFDTDAKNYCVPSEGRTFTVKVSTNMQYRVSIPSEAASWLIVADTRAMRNETLTFTVTENTEYAERSATVRLLDADGNSLQEFTVEQSAAKCANNVIFYTTSNGIAVAPTSTEGFGANIISNTYENGQGKIVFDGNITAIGESAFSDCSSLKSITIPDSVTSIGKSAFSFCRSLTRITIPDGVTSIGERTFYYCSSLTSITIPDSVTSIGERTFYYCSSLTSITIPDSVTSIGEGTFSSCSSLTSITIPDSVTSIGEGTFSSCSSLTSITIPDSVISIGERTFSSCSSLTSITIPDSVTEIGSFAFFECKNLQEVYCKPVTPPSIGEWVFYHSEFYPASNIYVPTASVDAYKAAADWREYADKIGGYDF